jgi:endo-alpha-N-acetylgalactosaminidase
VAVCPSELRLVVGASARLLAEVAPATAFNRNVWWTSDHTDVVRVDVSGRVTATALGSCLVTATSAAGEAHASCLVTVVVSTTDDLRCSC